MMDLGFWFGWLELGSAKRRKPRCFARTSLQPEAPWPNKKSSMSTVFTGDGRLRFRLARVYSVEPDELLFESDLELLELSLDGVSAFAAFLYESLR